MYRGKKRDQPTPFSYFGKGFDVVCRAVIDLNIRFMGYFVICDSWYTSIPLLNQLLYWNINYLGTIKLNRKGLGGENDGEHPFNELKKKLERAYDHDIGGIEGAQLPQKGKRKKFQGFKKGHFVIQKVRGHPIVVNIQKDNKVMSEAGNCISMDSTTFTKRWNKKKHEKESISVWSGHAIINKVYGMLDQATAWRTSAGGHKWKVMKSHKSILH